MHTDIVKYIQHVSTASHVYIIMEYIENGSLRSLLHKCGNLPELLVCTYLEQVLFGLQYLHHQGVIHRDIKSANLLVSTDGTIKVTDFGVSTKYELTGKTASDVAGTPNWSLSRAPTCFASPVVVPWFNTTADRTHSGTRDHPDAATHNSLRHLELGHHNHWFVVPLDIMTTQHRIKAHNTTSKQSC